MIRNVCVFASSCNFLDESYYTEAAELGRMLAESGMDMIYGGSCLGLMWACAKEVKDNGRRLIGVMPEKLKEMDVFSDYCDEFFLTPCMRSRKAKMDELSEALIALPGGFGTLEELSEMRYVSANIPVQMSLLSSPFLRLCRRNCAAFTALSRFLKSIALIS